MVSWIIRSSHVTLNNSNVLLRKIWVAKAQRELGANGANGANGALGYCLLCPEKAL